MSISVRREVFEERRILWTKERTILPFRERTVLDVGARHPAVIVDAVVCDGGRVRSM